MNNNGFPERCKRFFRSKGLDQPRCSCSSCWEHYFITNPTKLYTATKALKEYGAEAVKIAQGKERALEVEMQETLDIAAGRRRGRSNYVQIGYERGEKYVRHLLRHLAQFPVEVLA